MFVHSELHINNTLQYITYNYGGLKIKTQQFISVMKNVISKVVNLEIRHKMYRKW